VQPQKVSNARSKARKGIVLLVDAHYSEGETPGKVLPDRTAVLGYQIFSVQVVFRSKWERESFPASATGVRSLWMGEFLP
jgi:hypothetical protein